MAKKYIDVDKVKAEIKRYKNKADERLKIRGRTFGENQKDLALQNLCGNLLHFIESLQQDQPDKETILRICKLHKAWSITAPWENVEDFVTTNWNSENIV